MVATAGIGSEVFAYLKRLGGYAAPGVRILENVGLKGRAVSVAINDEGLSAHVTPLHMLWRVHGYDPQPRVNRVQDQWQKGAPRQSQRPVDQPLLLVPSA